MKYADGPAVEVEVLIGAPIEVVWELVTDIDLPARFSSEFRGGQWLDPEPAVGARFTGRSHHDALGTWETTSFVARYQPPAAFGWDVNDPDYPTASWWFTLDPEPTGTRLRQGMRMGPGRSGLNLAIDAMPDKEEKIIGRRLAEHEQNMRATLDGIRQLAEARR